MSEIAQLLERGDQSFSQGDVEGAGALFAQALALAGQDDHRSRAMALDGLGAVLAATEQLEDAAARCQEAIALIEAHDLKDLSTPYSNLASVLVMSGHEVDESLSLWERALAIERAREQEDEQSVASLLMDMAIAAGFVPDWPRADALIDEALIYSERVEGPLSYLALSQRVYKLECCDHLGQPKMAQQHVATLMSRVAQANMDEHRALIEQGLPMLATALSQQGRCDEADEIFTKVLDALEALDDVDEELLALIRSNQEANAQFQQQIMFTAAQWETEEELSIEAYRDQGEEE